MAGDAVEIAAERGHVDRHVHRRLAAVDQHRHVGAPGDRAHVHDGAGDVRHMGDGDQPGARADGGQHLFGGQAAVRLGLDPAQHDALPLAQEMPRHDVGVMLEDREQDLVPRLQPRRGPGVADEVDRLGRARGEDHLVLVRRAEEAGNDPAHPLVILGGEVRQVVQPTVDVGVFARIGAADRVDHDLRLLRARAVVEIDQRPPVHLRREDREIGADGVEVEAHVGTPGIRPSVAASIDISRLVSITGPKIPSTTKKGLRKPCTAMVIATIR